MPDRTADEIRSEVSKSYANRVRPVLEELPMEFALEAKALLAVSLEGAVG